MGAVESDSKVGATRASVGADITVLGIDDMMLLIVWGDLLLVLGPVKGWCLAFVDADRNGTNMRLRGSACQKIGCSGWSSLFWKSELQHLTTWNAMQSESSESARDNPLLGDPRFDWR